MEYLLLLTLIIIIVLIFIFFYKENKNDDKQLVSCLNRRFGCCNDFYTPKLDIFGSNCRGF